MNTPGTPRFYVHIWNHPPETAGATALCTYIRNGAIQAGYRAAYTTTLPHDPDGIHLLIDAFDETSASQLVAHHQQHGTRFAILCTETITGDTFNDLGVETGTDYSRTELWEERFKGFEQVAAISEAIWFIARPMLPDLRRLFPDKRILKMPICFDPMEAAVDSAAPPPKMHAAMFFGRLTPARAEIIDRINKTVPVFHPRAVPNFALPTLVRSSMVCLQLALTPDYPFPSIMRQHQLLTYGGYVISERAPEGDDLDPYLEIVPRADLPDAVTQRLRDRQLPRRAHETLLRYQRDRPLATAFRALLAESFPDVVTPA